MFFKHFSLIMTAAVIILSAVLFKACSDRANLESELRLKDGYIRDTEMTKNGEIRELQMTISQFSSSTDSINLMLDSLRKELGISKKNLAALQYISGKVKVVGDTVSLRDTVFVENLSLDTLIKQDEWLSYAVHLEYPNTLKLDLKMPLEFSVISSYKKEYVGKRSKIFFVRWFQKKRKYISVDVVEDNPYVELEQTRFIEIVK